MGRATRQGAGADGQGAASSARVTAPVAVASRSFSKHPILRSELESHFSNVRFNDLGSSLSGPTLVDFLEGAEGAIIALEKVTDEVLAQLPTLRVISKYGVGLDALDTEAMERRGVALGWTGGVNRESVCELVLCFMLGAAREVFRGVDNIRQGRWEVSGGTELAGKTVGIIGCGHVGQRMLELLRPFGCRILVNDIVDVSDILARSGAEACDKDTLYREAEFVTLHLPYSRAVHHMIGARELALMSPRTILVNSARGGLVDEPALARALREGSIRAAAFDVFEREPPPTRELLDLPNFYATSHIGGAAAEAILNMGRAAIANLVRLMDSEANGAESR